MGDTKSDPRGLFRSQEGLGIHGESVPGPPWILGHRGAPREAPENTLAALRRAVELGLDGFAYDLRACATGELVLLADATLDRTSDGHGALATRTLPEISGLDAGGWFGARFAGEPLALIEETLELPGNQAGSWPQHLVLVREPGLIPDLARVFGGGGRQLSVRVASPRPSVCVEARIAGLEAMLIADAAGEREREIVRAERLSALAAPPGAWEGTAEQEWRCERWSLGVDEPDDLLAACRLPLNGFHTNEPRRALAARALAFLTPEDRGPYPLRAPELKMEPGSRLDGPGEWCGHWELEAAVRNPFPFAVRVALELVIRRGAFEAEGLPSGALLKPGQQTRFPFRLVGGSWRVGGDPLLAAHLFWDSGPGRPGEHLVLDAPLRRVRELRVGAGTLRVELVRERRGDRRASMTVGRRGSDLLVSIEDAAGLEDARTVVWLDGARYDGGAGLRAPLPADFHLREGGVPFSVGIRGRAPVDTRGGGAGWTWRRWAGGLPPDPDSGAAGRLLSDTRT
jgi:hypothetical protein